jgi:hypothetical protein
MGEAVVKQKRNWKGRGRFGPLLLVVTIALLGLVQGVQTAHADVINPIVPGSVELTDKTSPAGPTYVWHDVEVSGRWAINDYSGQEGDTFTIGLPAASEWAD